MPQAEELAAEELPERVRRRRGLLQQLPPGAAQIHPVADQPEPHTAPAQSQHQRRGSAGEPESRRLGAMLAWTAHFGCTPTGRSAQAQLGESESRQPGESWGSVPAHAGRVFPDRHAGTRGFPAGP
ncbi:hypothetical protein QTP86_028233 [Hemibagrus guttatus]|nr:hypothetical protein QTP86_028233 [Hemibagrus guttatus]